MIILLMGVSGSGKSTVGALLAERLACEFQDGDVFHPAANVEKMHEGIPLSDADRLPWLNAIAAWIDEARAAGKHAVVACSALKRCYREILIGNRADVRLVYLRGDEALIAGRLQKRKRHFMPQGLLKSQFEALEEPGAEEKPIIVEVDRSPAEIVEEIVGSLGGQAVAR
jgi:carbohydrate kinase (thermoresistant glucokinase family)